MCEEEAIGILRRSGWLATEPEWLAAAMTSGGRLRSFRQGEFTHYVDDDVGGMFGIVEGSFGVLVPGSNNELTLCHILAPGSWFGAGPILTQGRRSLTYKAMEPSRILHVSLSELHAIGERNPEFYRRIGALSENSYYAAAIRVVGDLLISSAERRVAAVLVRLVRSLGSGSTTGPWSMRVSQSELGQMSNCSRDRASRALQKFVKAGWIRLDYRTIVIEDLASLTAFAQG